MTGGAMEAGWECGSGGRAAANPGCVLKAEPRGLLRIRWGPEQTVKEDSGVGGFLAYASSIRVPFVLPLRDEGKTYLIRGGLCGSCVPGIQV